MEMMFHKIQNPKGKIGVLWMHKFQRQSELLEKGRDQQC
jgi:hypothetical protein